MVDICTVEWEERHVKAIVADILPRLLWFLYKIILIVAVIFIATKSSKMKNQYVAIRIVDEV
jgi:hypothetical protein